MRVDKFLWCIRVFKTRGLAATACKTGKVTVDDQTAKASRELKPEQIIRVRKGAVWYHYRVLQFPKSRVGAKLVPEYSEDITPQAETAKLTFIQVGSKLERRTGTGRPTKKERRTLDKYRDE